MRRDTFSRVLTLATAVSFCNAEILRFTLEPKSKGNIKAVGAGGTFLMTDHSFEVSNPMICS